MSDVTTQRERARPEMSGPVLGMVLFVASEAMFFAAFFGGYFTIRANAPAWPPPDVPHLKIDIASILTVVLVASSVAVQLSLRATRDGKRRPALWWLGATIALGVLFLGLQLYDYSQLGFGLKDGVFGTLFRGRLSPAHHDPLAAGAIYWDFVDVVWLCLFTTFYLLTPR